MGKSIFAYRGYLQGVFMVLLVLFAWFRPEDVVQSSRLDTCADVLAIATLAAGASLRIWAVSYPGKPTRSHKLKAPKLVTTGPYAFVRNPIYVGNFLIGLGLVIIAEGVALLPVYLGLFGYTYRKIVTEEETFLRHKFHADFERYCASVPRWLPRLGCPPNPLSFGSKFHVSELGTTFGILVGALFFEWIEYPSHRLWLASIYNWLNG
jgi:protein-S-isoprenylcysteine O-methyltransferase Ste14